MLVIVDFVWTRDRQRGGMAVVYLCMKSHVADSSGSLIIAPKKVVYSDALDFYVGCLSSNLGCGTSYSVPGSLWFSSVLPGKRRDRPPNPLSFIRLH
jgi:hypothetical protein